MIFINLKTYPKGTGHEALKFVKDAEQLRDELGVPITILAQAVDLWLITPQTSLPIWAQHVDNIDYGKNTGWTLPQAIIEAGAKGTMINHAAHKLPLADLRSIIEKYQSPNFSILVSSTTPEEAFQLDEERPAYLSYEPSVYIGTKTSVLDVSPALITAMVSKLQSPFVIGAGIHTGEHIIKGLQLGAKGFLISSDILLSEDPKTRLREYMMAYKSVFNNPQF